MRPGFEHANTAELRGLKNATDCSKRRGSFSGGRRRFHSGVSPKMNYPLVYDVAAGENSVRVAYRNLGSEPTDTTCGAETPSRNGTGTTPT